MDEIKKMLATRRQAKWKNHATIGHQRREFSGAHGGKNYNRSDDKNCEEIDNVSRDKQSVFPQRANQNGIAWTMPQDSFRDGDSCSISSHHPGDPLEKKKHRFRLWGNQIVFPQAQQLPRNERSQSERIIEDEESLSSFPWLDRTDDKQIDDSVESSLVHLDGPPKKNYHIRLWGIDIETESTSDQIEFPDPNAPRSEWGQSERVFNAKKAEIIAHRTRTDQNLQQSSALNPYHRGMQPMSGPSIGKYNSLPHFQQELQNHTAGGFWNSERVEGSLVGRREKLQEIHQELGSNSRARRSLNDSVSSLRARSPDDDFVSAVLSLRHGPPAEKFT